MSIQKRFNIDEIGEGTTTLILSHGYGCDQSMWRRITPSFLNRYRIVLFDTMGHGMSDLSAYSTQKYSSLNGYASDVLEIARHYQGTGPLVYIGHSVSAMVGMLAALRAPDLFAAQVMVSPSPRYVDDGDYVGGFSREQMNGMLSALKTDYASWAADLAPIAVGAVNGSELVYELTNSFCRNDPQIASNYARILLTTDSRADLPRMTVPTLILQCDDDAIAPASVGHYMVSHMPNATMALIHNVGHCPHLTQPQACVSAIRQFFDERGL